MFYSICGFLVVVCLCGECEGSIVVCGTDIVCAVRGDICGDAVWRVGVEFCDGMGDVSLFRVGCFRPLFFLVCPCINGDVHVMVCIVGCGDDCKRNGCSLRRLGVSELSVSIDTDIG